MVEYYFTEENVTTSDFDEKSKMVLESFLSRIGDIAIKFKSPLTVYLHNLSRFDGLLLLDYMRKSWGKRGNVKMMDRNHHIYEIKVRASGRRVLFRFKDSMLMLKGSLDSLSKNLCPELGYKGSIDSLKVNQDTLSNMKEDLRKYLKQDVLLLGGVMQKLQGLIWDEYGVDIECKLTLPSFAMLLFRMKFLDADKWHIYKASGDEDTFIRSGYYGGHVDIFIPFGKNLYYYDLNSLYPFVMRDSPMPVGTPVWHSNLSEMDLDSIFGFLEAVVNCPRNIKRPFLPFRKRKDSTLIFPTGKFRGVYFSEELKYARTLGYTVVPIEGYLFEKSEGSPLEDYVRSLSENRIIAKQKGNTAMSYIYKLLMNSLYGRFGISPECTTSEICDDAQRKYLVDNCDKLLYSEAFDENLFIVGYRINAYSTKEKWRPLPNSAVQISAAVTAYARILLYPHISRDDCYYTDTDSVVLGQPLPYDEVSSSEIGKLKLEDRIEKGLF